MATASIYPCAQSALYPTIRLLTSRLSENIDTFAGFRGIYSDEFCNDLLAQCDVAENTPSEQARALTHETVRLEMIPLGKACRNKWQALKRYIAAAYPDSETQNWNAAGWQYYEKASNESWADLIAMMKAGSSYINTHQADLQANLNMPSTFAVSFNAAITAFEAKYTQFMTAQQDARMGTELKVTQNNDIYSAIINVCNDAAVMYADDERMRECFSFSAVCDLVAAPGASGADFTVINAYTNQPMIAEVQVQGSDKHVTTGADGKGTILQLAAGETVFNVSADGCADQSITHTLNTGTTSRITVNMVPMSVPAMSSATAISSNGEAVVTGS